MIALVRPEGLRRELASPMYDAMLGGLNGAPTAVLAEHLGCSSTLALRAIHELRDVGLVHPKGTLIAYLEPWPALDSEAMARVLHQVRRQPRTERELSRTMLPFELELAGGTSHRIRITGSVARLRSLGHIASGGRVWLASTRYAVREGAR